MTRGVEALVEPRLLRWARESGGFDTGTAARKARVKEERLRAWEEGRARPTIGQLRTLARVYKRPIAVFYLPAPPPDLEPPRDYRRLPGQVSGVESPELRFEIRRAVARREIALQLMADEGEEPPELAASALPTDNPTAVGRSVRQILGVDLRVQSSWRNPYDAFNGWRSALEEAGVLVLQMTEVEPGEARGFSLSEFPLPVAVANIKDPPRGRTFSLLHEFAHILIRSGGLCDFDDESVRASDALAIERFCNAVAGAALVPEDALLTHEVVRAHRYGDRWEETELVGLSSFFGVSEEVILRRLLDLGKTSQAFYLEMRERFLAQYEERRRQRRPGFAPPHQVALASVGPTFAGLVLSSYADGHITASDVSEYLGVRLKHLPRIERYIQSRGRLR